MLGTFTGGISLDLAYLVELAELYKMRQVQRTFAGKKLSKSKNGGGVKKRYRAFRPRPLLFACTAESHGPRVRPDLNLPGWRWGTIKQIPLVAVSRPLHSGVCETRQDIGLPVLHSEISDSGLLRTRGDQQDKSF